MKGAFPIASKACQAQLAELLRSSALVHRALIVCSIVGAGFVSGCGSSSTSVTATSPSATKCAISATSSLSSFPSSGGSGSLVINSARECPWTISADTPWIVPDQTSGQGATTLPFRVAANGTPQARRGALTISAARVEVAQEGAPCRFDLDTAQADVAASGGNLRIGVTAMTGCAWTARALDSWINITSGASAGGSGVIQLSIAANGGAARQGTVSVANQTIVVAQRSATSPGGGGPSPPPGGGQVELDGRLSALRGACPNLTFVLSGSSVYADGATQYRDGNCKKMEEGQHVAVSGQRKSDGRVSAERIDLKPKK